jgi:3'-phosphoadenosine 5'-phosphosulfate sulfotransferase (PAPS reductase)/FAD synthetase
VNTFKEQMLAGRVYQRSAVRSRKLMHAVEGVKSMLLVAPRSYVSISFGKQSLCVAHMVYLLAPHMPMFFLASDETWHMYDYRAVIDAFTARWPINLQIVQTNRLFDAPSWKAARDSGDRDLQDMCSRADWDGWYWGLAKDESPVRAKTCSMCCELHPTIYRYVDGKLRCCPIQDWSIYDLAAYIGEHDIPLLNIYKRFGLHMRTTARITKKAQRMGGGWLRATNSAGYRKLVNQFEELER